jgi:hypothetical protein
MSVTRLITSSRSYRSVVIWYHTRERTHFRVHLRFGIKENEFSFACMVSYDEKTDKGDSKNLVSELLLFLPFLVICMNHK